MARFDSAIALAQRLIKKNGQLVTWKTAQKPAPNPTPWNGGPAPLPAIETDVYICFVTEENDKERLLWQALANREVMFGRLPGLMAVKPGLVPSGEDTVIRDGKELRIRSLDVLRPNHQGVLYIIEFYG